MGKAKPPVPSDEYSHEEQLNDIQLSEKARRFFQGKIPKPGESKLSKLPGAVGCAVCGEALELADAVDKRAPDGETYACHKGCEFMGG